MPAPVEERRTSLTEPVDNRDFLGKVGARRSAILGILGAKVRQSRGVYNKYLPIGVQVVGCVLFVEMWIFDANRAAYGRRNRGRGMDRPRLCFRRGFRRGVKNMPALDVLIDRLAPGAGINGHGLYRVLQGSLFLGWGVCARQRLPRYRVRNR